MSLEPGRALNSGALAREYSQQAFTALWGSGLAWLSQFACLTNQQPFFSFNASAHERELKQGENYQVNRESKNTIGQSALSSP